MSSSGASDRPARRCLDCSHDVVGRRSLRCEECKKVTLREQHRAASARRRDARKNDPVWRAARAAETAQWRAAHPAEWARIARRRHLKGTYNITPEQYDQLLAGQHGGCAVCGTTFADDALRSLHVDHDHNCCPGKRSCGACVRGLLCKGCNTALGAADDDAFRLRALARYVETRTRRQPPNRRRETSA